MSHSEESQTRTCMLARVLGPLSVLGTPVKVRVRWLFLVVWPGSVPCLGRWTVSRGRGGAPVAQRGRTTLRPARVRRILWVGQDEAKALWFRLFAASREQQVCTLRVPAPSLIWVHGQWSGDMMIDGVPGVRGH